MTLTILDATDFDSFSNDIAGQPFVAARLSEDLNNPMVLQNLRFVQELQEPATVPCAM